MYNKEDSKIYTYSGFPNKIMTASPSNFTASLIFSPLVEYFLVCY